MYKIIRYFNQNREKIVYIAVVLLFGFGVLQFFNMLAANKNEQLISNTQNQSVENATTNYTNVNSIDINSALGEGEGQATHKEQADIISQFVQCCNEGNTSEAYNLLSQECKETMYPTLETFIKNYYNNNFQSNKSYNIQRWSDSIYKVDLKENVLQTGKITNESKQDYITTVYQDREEKLNINNYIKRTELNKQETVENVNINIIKADTFMDYETYTLEVKNNGDKHIYLDDLEETSTIYLVDENDIKHTAYSHELSKEALHIYPYSTETIKITFSNRYISGREISKMVFGNVIIDETNNEIKKISIDL